MRAVTMNPDSISILACPVTKADLKITTESTLRSKDGTKNYSVRDGVPNFLSSRSWETPNYDRLRRLLRVARADGYQKAIETVMEDLTYVTDLSRTIYMDLLPLRKDSQVLEIGASLGQHGGRSPQNVSTL